MDFVLSKIALSVGTRAESVQASVAYEIPKEVVTEAIVNAVAHRDYTDNGSVQVMLFADRLEVWNPGRLPPPLTLDMISPCAKAGLPEPEFAVTLGFVTTVRRAAIAGQPESQLDGVQAELSDRDIAMLQACGQEAATSRKLRAAASYSGRTRNFRICLDQLLQKELLEMTVPDKPTSPLQRYRLTDKGRAVLANLDLESKET